VNPHLVPSQVAVPCAGGTHGVQDMPHVATAVSGWQLPLQSWLPVGQSPPHDIAAVTQAPAHSLVSLGQVAPQDVPSQVAVPPVGATQGLQLCAQ